MAMTYKGSLVSFSIPKIVSRKKTFISMNHAPSYSHPPGFVDIRIFLIAEGIVRNDIDQYASSFFTFQRDKIS